MTVSVITFVVWKRARFFGTAAPLLVGVLVFSYRGAHAFLRFHLPVSGAAISAVFMAGVSADLLESRYALAANAVVFGVLIANAMIDVYWADELHFSNPMKNFAASKGLEYTEGPCGARANS